MIEKNFIEQSVAQVLNDTSLFAVEIKVSTRNKITVFLDGDHGVPISECVKVSRHIESLLDREVEDFELEVSSVGIDKPLKMLRQYKKNIGRNIQIEDINNNKYEGKLIDADDNHISIELDLSKKKKKKDQPAEDPIRKFSPDQIKEAKILVSFKNVQDDIDDTLENS
jgi:ribosome maturation factor RimP